VIVLNADVLMDILDRCELRAAWFEKELPS